MGQRGLDVTTLLPKASPELYMTDVLLDVGENQNENLSYITSSVVGKMARNMSARKNDAKDRASYLHVYSAVLSNIFHATMEDFFFLVFKPHS